MGETESRDLLVGRDALDRTRLVEGTMPAPAGGEALLRVDRFGLSANNVTYALFGEGLRYWDFFPAPEGWGRIPVWGFADVVASESDALAEGSRVYGYLPMSTHLVVVPVRPDERGFVDGTPARAGLPSAYNAYRRVDADPAYDPGLEDEQVLLLPLFFLSFLVDDDLAGDGVPAGGTVVVLSSASSKTAIGTAFLLARRPRVRVVGLTSAGNADFVRRLGYYDDVVTYDALEGLPGGAAMFVDIAGNADVRADVHARYGDDLARSLLVGATHQDTGRSVDPGGTPLPGPQPSFFFAPERLKARTAEWGREGFDARFVEAWRSFATSSRDWLTIERHRGAGEVERAYRDLLAGRVDPAAGHVLSMEA